MAAKMRISLATALSATLLAACSTEPSCQNEKLGISPSPDGSMVAVVFSRNCGATTSNNIQVSIVRRGEEVVSKGNVLILDQAPRYTDNYKPMWRGEKQLVIPLPSNSRIFLKNSDVLGVNIVYK
jgi:hypothetical protein